MIEPTPTMVRAARKAGNPADAVAEILSIINRAWLTQPRCPENLFDLQCYHVADHLGPHSGRTRDGKTEVDWGPAANSN